MCLIRGRGCLPFSGAWVHSRFFVGSVLLIFVDFCVVCCCFFDFVLCLVYPMLPVSLNFPFLVAPWVFPNVCLNKVALNKIVIVTYKKKSLKISEGKSEAVNQRTDSTMTKQKKTKRQTIIQKTQQKTNPNKTEGELRRSGKNPMISNNEFGKGRLQLQQTEHVRSHLCHRYSVAVNYVMVATVKRSKWRLQLSH